MLNIPFGVPSVKRIRYRPETWIIPRKTYSPVNYPPVLSWDVWITTPSTDASVKNPFNFKHFDLTQLRVYLDGQQHSLIPIEPNFNTNNYITAYSNLFAGTGKLMKDEGTDIKREDFPGGYALYVFDLTADLAEEGHFNLMKHGNVRLDLKFGAALPNTITLLHTPSLKVSWKLTRAGTLLSTTKTKDECFNN